MNIPAQICTVILLLSVAWSQVPDEQPTLREELQRGKAVFNESTQIGLFRSSGLVWIRLYQKMISSQDVPMCNFSPSCSNFGFEAIQREGLFRGMLMTTDRLLRCNPFVGSDHYPLGEKKYLDPVQHYTSRK